MTPSPPLVAALRARLGAKIGLGWADPRCDYPPSGATPPPGAVPARLREFHAGRHAARAALAAAGLPAPPNPAPPNPANPNPAPPIPIGPDRAPVWPPGIVGSLSHCASLCLAVVARTSDLTGLGLDVEDDAPLPPDLWDIILSPAELAHLPPTAPGQTAKRVFVAKEAAYKAQYPQSLALFDFHTLSVDIAEDHFSARFTRPIPPYKVGHVIHGQFVRAPGLIAAVAQM